MEVSEGGLNADGRPEPFSDSAGEGNWNPRSILASDGGKTYFRRAPTEAEIERVISRLKARGS